AGPLRRLDELLDALDAQTCRQRLEIILSLDGGEPLPEGSASKADLVAEGPARGPAAARNRGWRSSGCRFVLFTDSDCLPEPDWAAELLKALEGGADGAKGVYSRGGSRIIQRLAQIEFEERYRLLSGAGDRGVDMVDTYSAGFSRAALELVGGFDESFSTADHEDVDLSYRMRREGLGFAFVPGARVEHVHRPTLAGYFAQKRSRGCWRVRVHRSHPGRSGRDPYTPAMLKLQMILVLPLLPLALACWPLAASATAPLAWCLLFLVSALPLTITALRHDAALAPLVPLFAFWRALALVSGILSSLTGRKK
ncbi:glycosyltransferase, partial [Candidatus Fermentibacterales bacterium]|nr:glycosyltransferase [Candidatus Fermentibacterales bacterium]